MTTTDPTDAGTRRPSTRRFGILDGMVLVAAMACGLACGRSGVMNERHVMFPSSPYMLACLQARAVIEVGLGFLTPITCALPVLRWVGRGRPLRRLMAEPGFVAGLVVIATAVVSAASREVVERLGKDPLMNPVLRVVIGGRPSNEMPPWAQFSSTAGLLILVAWATLALGGRWRSRPTWIDRAGRIAGFTWIALLPIQVLLHRLSMYVEPIP